MLIDLEDHHDLTNFILWQVYVDGITFGVTNNLFCKKKFKTYAERIWNDHDGRIEILYVYVFLYNKQFHVYWLDGLVSINF